MKTLKAEGAVALPVHQPTLRSLGLGVVGSLLPEDWRPTGGRHRAVTSHCRDGCGNGSPLRGKGEEKRVRNKAHQGMIPLWGCCP